MTRPNPLGLTALAALALAAPRAPLDAQMAAAHHPHVVEIAAEDYAFDAPDVIPSGWTTIRFENVGDEPHMVFMGRLPADKTFEDYETELQTVFNGIWVALRQGEVDMDGAFAMLGESMPPWFPTFVGGPGIQAAGRTSEVTLHLEPGDYVIECYIKNADGQVHYMEGMARPLTVSADPSGAAAPTADIQVTLSNSGLELGGDLAPGMRTFAVHVAENPEQGFGHSAHLVRLDADTDVGDVVGWMNWFDLEGLRAPAPAEFLGGMHPMPVGQTAYFTAELSPGRYLLISEATAGQGVLKEFTVR